MGWVEKRGKVWRGRVRVGAETLSTSTCPTKGEAQELLRALEFELDRGTWVDPKAGDTPFEQWARLWLRTRGPGVLAETTRHGDESRLRIHLLPAFGALPLNEISPLRVAAWVSDLSATRSAKTVRHCHALLSQILQAAVEEALIRKNPCVKTRLPKSPRKEHVRLPEPELQRFVLAVEEGMPRALVVTLAMTGMRWGEAVGLRVEHLDLLKRELHVRETLTEVGGRLGRKLMPKTRRSYRTISLPAAAIDQLIPLVVDRAASDLVFRTNDECRQGECGSCATARLDGRDVTLVHGVRNRAFRKKHWDPARKAAGVTERLTPHQLRHTHVAMLIADGHGLPVIQDRLGHESIQITSDIYGYLMPRLDTAVIDTLDRALAFDLGAPPAPTSVGARVGATLPATPADA